jgi:iron complex outermembrane receptor protein
MEQLMKISLVAGAVASALFTGAAGAQTAPPDATPPSVAPSKSDAPVKKVESITVTASPLGRAESEMAQPATVLTGDDLRRKRAASIGDTLAQEPGVQSSSFGPGAGRPIIRGLDGPRIRVLENGIGTLDASTVSPDHMVTTESLHADQIEILRGPASLLYGSGAIGGIVNVVSNLIPRERGKDFGGDVETRFATGNHERTGAFNLNGATGDIAWHVDAFKRKTEDYKIPGHAVRDDPDSAEGRLPDSAVDAKGAGAGVSWVGSRGYIGIGTEGLTNVYGIPSGEGSHIHLRQKRYEISSEVSDPLAGFSRLRFRLGHTDYQHEEIEATGGIATTFKNKASESRLELTHVPLAGITGTIGVQVQDSDLSALGEEAVFPKTRSKATGVFVIEQKELGAWIVDAGIRFERNTRRPTLDADNADKFAGAVGRDFNLTAPAAGLVWKLAEDYRLGVNVTQAQRAPTTEELYSNGAHGATSTFDVGDPTLRKEVSRNIDLTLRKVHGDVRWKVNLFANSFKNYVYAASVDSDGDGVADRVDAEGALDPAGEFLVQRFSQAEARFRGMEAELSYRPESGNFGVRVFGDMVRARFADGTNLPRISPARLGLELDGRRGEFSSHLTVIHALAQKRTAALETDTPGYTRVDAELAWQVESAKGRTLTVFLQGSNLLDREIRVHTSYLKDVAPLMGRSLTLGLRAEF